MRFVGSTIFVAPVCDAGSSESESIKSVEKSVLRAVKSAKEKASQNSIGRWSDPDFGPTEQDPTGKLSIYEQGQPPGPGYPSSNNIVWSRPCLAGDRPSVGREYWCSQGRLFKRPIGGNGIVQGRLGDGWFLGALGVIAQGCSSNTIENPKRNENIKALFWNHARFRRYGIYVCRFKFQSKWHYVLVDDQLPTFRNQNGTRVFARSGDENEMWVSIVEKAYAKLHGTYQGLVGGRTDQALRDLTGLPCETIGLQRTSEFWTSSVDRDIHSSQSLFDKLNRLVNAGAFIGCCMLPEPVEESTNLRLRRGTQGIVKRQTYPVLALGEVSGEQLAWLEDPWGDGGWVGEWGTGSPQYLSNQDSIRRQFGDEASDRGFFMKFKDWVEQFHDVYIAGSVVTMSTIADAKLDAWMVRGSWDSKSAGGNPANTTWVDNPVVRMRLYEPSTHLQIHMYRNTHPGLPIEESIKKPNCLQNLPVQPFSFAVSRMGSNGAILPVGFQSSKPESIWEIENKTEESPKHQTGYSYWGTVILETELEAGDYAVVPFTFEPGFVGEYCLEFYSGSRVSLDQGHQTLNHMQVCSVMDRTANGGRNRSNQPWNAPIEAGERENEITSMFELDVDSGVTWGKAGAYAEGGRVEYLNLDERRKLQKARECMMQAFLERGVTLDHVREVFRTNELPKELDLLDFKQGLMRLGFDVSDLPKFDLGCLIAVQGKDQVPAKDQLVSLFLNFQKGEMLFRSYTPLRLDDDFYFRPTAEIPGRISLRVMHAAALNIPSRSAVNSCTEALAHSQNWLITPSTVVEEPFVQFRARIGQVSGKSTILRFWKSSRNNSEEGSFDVAITLYLPEERSEHAPLERGVQVLSKGQLETALESHQNWSQLCLQVDIGVLLLADTASDGSEFSLDPRWGYIDTALGEQRDRKLARNSNDRNGFARYGESARLDSSPQVENVRDIMSARTMMLDLCENMKEETVMKQGEKERQHGFQKFQQDGMFLLDQLLVVDQPTNLHQNDASIHSKLSKLLQYNYSNGLRNEDGLVESQIREVVEDIMQNELDIMLNASIEREWQPQQTSSSAALQIGSSHQHLYSRIWAIPGEAKVHRNKLEKSANLREWFEGVDHNGNGKVESEEFSSALDEIGFHLTQDELNCVMQRFDKDQDGCIDYDEFSRVIQGEDAKEQAGLQLLQIVQNHASSLSNSLSDIRIQFGKPGSMKLLAKGFCKGLQGIRAQSTRKLFNPHTGEGRSNMKKLMWLFENQRNVNTFVKHASSLSLSLSAAQKAVRQVVFSLGGTGEYNEPILDWEGSSNTIMNAIQQLLASHGTGTPGAASKRMSLGAFEDMVLCHVANGMKDEASAEGEHTDSTLHIIRQLKEDFRKDDGGEQQTLPLALQLRLLLDAAGAFEEERRTGQGVSHTILAQVTLDGVIQRVCSKLRHMFRQQQQTRLGAVWHLVDVYTPKTLAPAGLELLVVVRNPDSGQQYKLLFNSVCEASWFSQVAPPPGSLCFPGSRESKFPQEQLHTAIEELVSRLRFVKPKDSSGHLVVGRQELVLTESKERSRKLQQVLEESPLPMFVNVTCRTVKFIVDSTCRQQRGGLKHYVLSELRRRPQVIQHIRGLSNRCSWKVVMKPLSGFGAEKLCWSDFKNLLDRHNNPFVVASLRPGNQHVRSKPVRDGGENPNFNVTATFEYLPTKHAVHTRRLVNSLVCRLGDRYMVVQVYDVERQHESGTTRKVFAYDPITQCEYHVHRRDSALESRKDISRTGRKEREGDSLALLPGESWEEVVHELELGEPISPRLVLRVMNQADTIGMGEIPISLATENPGVFNTLWVTLHDGERRNVGSVQVSVQFEPVSRTEQSLRALEGDVKRQLEAHQRKALAFGDQKVPEHDDDEGAEEQEDSDLEFDLGGFAAGDQSPGLLSPVVLGGIPNTGELVGEANKKIKSAQTKGFETLQMRHDVDSIAEKLKESEQIRAELEMSCRKHELELRKAQQEIEARQQQVVDLTRTKAKEQDKLFPHAGLRSKKGYARNGAEQSRHEQVAREEARRQHSEELKQLRKLEEENNKLRKELDKRGSLVNQEVSLLRKQLAQKEYDLKNEFNDKQRRLASAEKQLVAAQKEAADALKRAQMSTQIGVKQPRNASKFMRESRKQRMDKRRKREQQLKQSMGDQYSAYIRDLQQILGVVRKQVRRRRPEMPERAMDSLHRFLLISVDDKGKVQRVDFEESLLDFGVKLTPHELDMVSTHFDTNGDNQVDVVEFLEGIEGQVGDAELAAGSGIAAVRSTQVSRRY